MAENCTRAFGRYLRTLRERRGLSLSDVCSLSQTFPDPINKGYLSRCENGHQKLAFAKMIPLSRIYEVPAEVLVERMELDLELDRVGGAETEGLSYAELRSEAKVACDRGYRWQAYGLFRDAVSASLASEILARYRDRNEQVAVAHMNCATAAKFLSATRYSLHEYLYLNSCDKLGDQFLPALLERIAGCYRELSQMSMAQEYAETAIKKAQAIGSSDFLGHAFCARALVAMDTDDFDVAIDYCKKAYDAFKLQKSDEHCAKMLNNLAYCYFAVGRPRAARKSLEASKKISGTCQQLRSSAFSDILLGKLDALEDKPVQALKKWREAVRSAKKLNDKELRFRAELELLRQAINDRDEAVARSIHRRLQRLSPWLSNRSTSELLSFNRLVAKYRVLLSERVSDTQQSGPSASN